MGDSSGRSLSAGLVQQLASECVSGFVFIVAFRGYTVTLYNVLDASKRLVVSQRETEDKGESLEE